MSKVNPFYDNSTSLMQKGVPDDRRNSTNRIDVCIKEKIPKVCGDLYFDFGDDWEILSRSKTMSCISKHLYFYQVVLSACFSFYFFGSSPGLVSGNIVAYYLWCIQ